MKIYTAQIGYKGLDGYDITVKSGDKVFAPTWNMVMDYKRGKLSKEAYSSMYRELMLRSWREHRQAWLDLLNREEVTLVCYCRPGDFCHRLLLAEYLVKLGKHLGIEVIYMGERQ